MSRDDDIGIGAITAADLEAWPVIGTATPDDYRYDEDGAPDPRLELVAAGVFVALSWWLVVLAGEYVLRRFS